MSCLLLLGSLVMQAPGEEADPNQDLVDLNEQGLYAEAEAAARERLKDVESRHGAVATETADVLDVLVLSLWRGGKLKDGEALRLAERAVRIREEIPATRPEDLSRSLGRLAQVHFETDDLPGALALFKRALASREQALGPEHPQVGNLMVSIGVTVARMGDYPAARVHFERALEIARRTLPPGDPSLAMSLMNLGNLESLLAAYESARARFEESLRIWEAAYGAEHPHVADALTNLAGVMFFSGDYAEALQTHARALVIARKTFDRHHPVQSGADRRSGLIQAVRDLVRPHVGLKVRAERGIGDGARLHGGEIRGLFARHTGILHAGFDAGHDASVSKSDALKASEPINGLASSNAASTILSILERLPSSPQASRAPTTA